MATSCEHLKGLMASNFPPPRTPDACEECLVEGTPWVALRECRTCGHVGCCDSSPRRHATRHFHALGDAGRLLGLVLHSRGLR
jgi:Zn-finger in ubiquitin-hydrolases and other protein